MSRVDELRQLAEEVAREAIPTRACGTCRHSRGEAGTFQRCAALGFYAGIARSSHTLCGRQGVFWEPSPPRKAGALERACRWLFGGHA